MVQSCMLFVCFREFLANYKGTGEKRLKYAGFLAFLEDLFGLNPTISEADS